MAGIPDKDVLKLYAQVEELKGLVKSQNERIKKIESVAVFLTKYQIDLVASLQLLNKFFVKFRKLGNLNF
ncbi:MAG: hypothetical protein HC903_08305 [Methylacidiphilales bacterium]|nr:hypothetical protein [Candidatus Methylacidiphilales bacterium]NJR15719.1 hypothetical protein [Calothrix sp. CSU_2_0]